MLSVEDELIGSGGRMPRAAGRPAAALPAPTVTELPTKSALAARSVAIQFRSRFVISRSFK